MNFLLLYIVMFHLVLANFLARYLNPVKNPKFIQNRFLKALLIIPTKKKISTKGIAFYLVQLCSLLVIAISYLCGFMALDLFYTIMKWTYMITTFVAFAFTGILDKMNYAS